MAESREALPTAFRDGRAPPSMGTRRDFPSRALFARKQNSLMVTRGPFPRRPVKRATWYTLRHSLATYLLEGRYDVRTIQELVGHRNLVMTMIFTHVLNRVPAGVGRPVDGL